MYNRSKREIFGIIRELEKITSYEISLITGKTTENASMQLLIAHRWGLLSRKREGKHFVYSLTEKGEERLDWLNLSSSLNE